MRNYAAFLKEDRIAIFLFHGVIRQQRYAIRNYSRKHLLLDYFVSVIQSLCAHGRAVSMADVVNASLGKMKLPHRVFVVTFDDGFENNYSVAAPALVEFVIPATFYITTNFVESNASSWTDRIEYAIEKRETFQLELPFAGVHGFYTTRKQKMALLDQIRHYTRNNRCIDPYKFADDIWCQLGITAMEPDSDVDQKMSWLQVQELSRNRLFTIGGHGHTHRVLGHLEQSESEREITTSLEQLRTNLNIAIEHYSYPEGRSHCYSEGVIRCLQGEGIVSAVTAEPGINRVGEDLFQLKRIMVT